MAQYPSRQPRLRQQQSRGFTIVEVVVASFILIVGIVAVAGVVGSTLGNTARSEYMTQAATLATEKLEDLNRFPPSDANVTVTNGVSAGSLTVDTAGYFDEVYFSPAQGAIVETTTGLDANSNLQYTTTTYTPNGQMSAPVNSSSAPSSTGSIVFDRRWIIEQDQPVVGVRRVTVLVTLLNQTAASAVKFQMSMVRP
jgi:Tfp pilus assembly protein PilV